MKEECGYEIIKHIQQTKLMTNYICDKVKWIKADKKTENLVVREYKRHPKYFSNH
jgi:hypothetical protein